MREMSENIARNVTRVACEGINQRFTHAFLPAVFVVVFVVGTLSNIWGLRGVCANWTKTGNISVFLLNLGLADLLYLFTLPFLVNYYARGSSWQFGQPFCKITRFCFNLNLYGSIGFLTCISIYRYLGIVHPMRVMGKIRSGHSVAVSALVWVLVVIQILPDVFFDKNDVRKPYSCFDTTSNNLTRSYLSYSIGWTVTGFAFPLVIILVCYGHIVVVLARKSNVNPLLKQRCLKLVVILVILFSVCFIPYHVFRNLNLNTRILKLNGICHHSFDDIYIAHQVGRGLACLNSAINPLIYIVANDDFLTKLQNFGKQTRQSVIALTGNIIYRRPLEDPPLDTRFSSDQVEE